MRDDFQKSFETHYALLMQLIMGCIRHPPLKLPFRSALNYVNYTRKSQRPLSQYNEQCILLLYTITVIISIQF